MVDSDAVMCNFVQLCRTLWNG